MGDSIIPHKPISIVRVTFEFPPIQGGSVTHLLDSTNKIRRYVKDLHIIAPNFGSSCTQFDDNFEVPVIRIKYPIYLYKLQILPIPIIPFVLLFYAKNVSKYIKDKLMNNDLLYIHGTLLGSFLLMFLTIRNIDIPTIIVQDSANLFKINKKSSFGAHIAFIIFSIFKPGCLLIVNDGMGIEEYKKQLRNRNISYEIVNASIDTDYFSARPSSESDDVFTVLSTQRLDPFKSVDLGILAFKKFLEITNFPDNVKMILVGDGSERLSLEELAISEGISKWVEFHGEKKIGEVLNYLRLADVVVGTSLKSNLNLSIQEAMACEKPVITFNCGFEESKLISEMRNGILIKPGDINGFADQLELLYRNPTLRIEMGKCARETIVRDRNWQSRNETDFRIWSKLIQL